MVHLKELQNKLMKETADKDSDAVCSRPHGKADSSPVAGVTRSVVDLQYLFNEGTESSV